MLVECRSHRSVHCKSFFFKEFLLLNIQIVGLQMDAYWRSVVLPRILSIECIDVDVNTGRHSPLFAWMISSGEDLAMQR